MKRASAVLISFIVLAWVSPAEAAYVHRNVQATPIHAVSVNLAAQTQVVFETSNLTSGADPVLFLWSPSDQRQIAVDDNGGVGVNARLEVSPPYDDTYLLILVATDSNRGGQVDISRDGGSLASGVAFGGARITVPHSSTSDFFYETALATGGSVNTVVAGLACNSGELVAFDDDGGVGLGSRIRGRNICTVVVGSASRPANGATHLYVNDRQSEWRANGDRDGLGDALEAELGTCPDRSCPGSVKGSDTDLDGLSDLAEVFGVDDPQAPLYLPSWGADPRHKDIFIEIDYRKPLSSRHFDGAAARAAQKLYAAGSAAELQNPSGQPGVRLHFDLGIQPTSSADATLYGDWGGSQFVTTAKNDAEAARRVHMAPVRLGYFHYALASEAAGCGGQSPAGSYLRFSVRPGEPCVETFAHELGHSLRLQHWGQDVDGKANCKPNYVSLMNYAFSGRGLSFSHGANSYSLNPGRMDERLGVTGPQPNPGADPSVLPTWPFQFRVNGIQTDWNRDGPFQFLSVRASPTFADVGCSALTANAEHLAAALPSQELRGTPELTRVEDRLYALWVDTSGEIQYRWSRLGGPDPQGSCPKSAFLGDRCADWSEPQAVRTQSQAARAAAIAYDGRVLIVYQDGVGFVRWLHGRAHGNGDLVDWSREQHIPDAFPSFESDLDLAVFPIAREHTLGETRIAVALFYVLHTSSRQPRHHWHTLTDLSGNWRDQGAVRTRNGQPLAADGERPIAGTVVPWPSARDQAASGRLACGIFPNPQGEARFYCYGYGNNRWVDLTAQAYKAFRSLPKTTAKVGLAYHVLRTHDGSALGNDPTVGQFWMTLIDERGNPRTWISKSLDGSRPPYHFVNDLDPPETHIEFQYNAQTGNRWTRLLQGTGLPLYEDDEVSALKGLMISDRGSDCSWGASRCGSHLLFLPFADGTYWADLGDSNDFESLRTGLCRAFHREALCR